MTVSLNATHFYGPPNNAAATAGWRLALAFYQSESSDIKAMEVPLIDSCIHQQDPAFTDTFSASLINIPF